MSEIIDGRYRLDRPIGASRLATVFAATHVVLGEPLAVKVISPAGVPEVGVVERFLRECRLSRQRSSTHVPAVKDVGLLPDGRPYAVLGPIEGTPLTQVDAAILRQVCDAIAASHAEDLVLGGFTAANVFVTTTGHVTLVDFGVASASADVSPLADLQAIARLVPRESWAAQTLA